MFFIAHFEYTTILFIAEVIINK